MASKRLTTLKIKALKPGKYGDGDGLWLTVTAAGAKIWSFRFLWAGKGKEMGLGPEGDVSLAEAREAAQAARKLVRDKINPIVHRQGRKAEAEGGKTFAEVSAIYIAAHEAGWRNAKHKAQWASTLKTYADPVIGKMLVSSVETADISKILDPIWRTKAETASRLRGRIETVLDYATVKRFRTGENPARWKGHFEHILPAKTKISTVVHHAALPWKETGNFMIALRPQAGIGAWALQFAILTAARTGEVIGARWDEINLVAKVWTIPAGRMKAGQVHRVPLSDAALDILAQAAVLKRKPDGIVFPGSRAGKPMSNMTMMAVLKRMGRNDLTVHGFRSSFREWAAHNQVLRELAELSLAHAFGGKVEGAYQRDDLLALREPVMKDWATFCGNPATELQGAAEAAKAE